MTAPDKFSSPDRSRQTRPEPPHSEVDTYSQTNGNGIQLGLTRSTALPRTFTLGLHDPDSVIDKLIELGARFPKSSLKYLLATLEEESSCNLACLDFSQACPYGLELSVKSESFFQKMARANINLAQSLLMGYLRNFLKSNV